MAKPDLNTVGGLLLARGYDGQISRNSEQIVDSHVNTGATVVSPGAVVGRDPANVKGCRLAKATDELLGIVVRDPWTYHADSDGNIGFAQYRAVPFLRLGYINATPTEAVNAGDGVVAIFDGGTAVFTGLGSTAGGLSAGTRLLLKNHKWESDTAANASEPGEVSVLTGNSVNYVTY
jgi:hypothetical protein